MVATWKGGTRRWATVALIALVAVFGVMGGLSPHTAEAGDPPVGTFAGNRAPDFSSQTTDGRDVTLSDFRGTPTVVYFWATWCAICRADMPVLDERFLAAANLTEVEEPPLKPESGFALLAVNIQEGEARVRQHVEERGYSFPIVLDERGAVMQHYRVFGTPTYYFLDRDGIIRGMHVGPITEEQFHNNINAILGD